MGYGLAAGRLRHALDLRPFLDYDSTFKGSRIRRSSASQGPDGSEVRVLMDAWASRKANYTQGGHLLKDTRRVVSEWIPHYEQLGAGYPLRTIFASGTHSDINPNSGNQARGFADSIIHYNAAGTNLVQLLNGTLAQFCREVDAVEGKSALSAQAPGLFRPLLGTLAGQPRQKASPPCARTNVSSSPPSRSWRSPARLSQTSHAGTKADREKAEWLWAMLSDHAWNGTDPENKHHNAQLRRNWAGGLGDISQRLAAQAWTELGLKPDAQHVTVFNPLSFANDVLVTCDAAADTTQVLAKDQPVGAQFVTEAGQKRVMFVARGVPAFGFREFRLTTGPIPTGRPPFGRHEFAERPVLSSAGGPRERRFGQPGSHRQRAGARDRRRRSLLSARPFSTTGRTTSFQCRVPDAVGRNQRRTPRYRPYRRYSCDQPHHALRRA